MRFSLAFLTLALAAAAHAQSQTPPLFTEIGPVKSFTLTDQDGKPFSPEKLRGKVWIAHFFFTSCTQGCEKTKLRMMEIQDAIRGKNDLALVSISVNPDVDTPEVLTAYAKDMKAEPKQWFFVTGPQGEVYETVKKSFFQAVDRDPSAKEGAQINHTFALVVVDRDGKIAGYTDGRDPENVSPLLERVRGIASERYLLPSVNAGLNGTAAFLLVLGYAAIRRRKVGLHKTAMVAAFACSTIFLGCYLYYHFVVLRGESPRLVGPGAVRTVYLAILLSHTILAVAVAPLAIFTLVQGFKDNLAKHVRIARWTLPIWLYVSVTGVVVYAMLYHLYPPY
jgi:protein SCO1/2